MSEWGHDFRPSYLALGALAEDLGRPPILALTATAPPLVREEIVKRLALRDPAIVVRPGRASEPALRSEGVHERGREAPGAGAVPAPPAPSRDRVLLDGEGRRGARRALQDRAHPRRDLPRPAHQGRARPRAQALHVVGQAHRDDRDQRLRPGRRQARHPLRAALPGAGLARGVRPGGRTRRTRRPAHALHPALGSARHRRAAPLPVGRPGDPLADQEGGRGSVGLDEGRPRRRRVDPGHGHRGRRHAHQGDPRGPARREPGDGDRRAVLARRARST